MGVRAARLARTVSIWPTRVALSGLPSSRQAAADHRDGCGELVWLPAHRGRPGHRERVLRSRPACLRLSLPLRRGVVRRSRFTSRPVVRPWRMDPDRSLLQLAQGYQLSQALYVVAKLGVADFLKDGPLDMASLAERAAARPAELRRVLRALVAAGVFLELPDGRFALNDEADALRGDAPGRARDVVLNFGEQMYRAFGDLLHTVRTGNTAFDHVYGMGLFEYYAQHPDAEASGSARMLARTLPVARELAKLDFLPDQARVLVDVGGGVGTLLSHVLSSRENLHAVLLERPGVLALAREHLTERGVADRCDLVEGDFFGAIPAGGDVYLLKSVLHDWDDDHCLSILRNCREAMHDQARLAIVEFVQPEQMTAAPPLLAGALLDLIMMAYAGGRERTLSEFTDLLNEAGLGLDRVTELTSGPRLMIASRA